MILSLLLLVLSLPAAAENIRVTIFHTNDIHGWILPQPAHFYAANPKRLIGGAAALASAIKRYGEPGRPSLLLDAGDWFQGTPEGTLTRGRAVADVFNALNYDAVEVGNHEFDIDQKDLKTLVASIRVPVLGANVVDAATGRGVDYLRPYVIKEVAGVKIGIFGLLTTKMRTLVFAKNIAGLRFEDELETAKRMVAELRAKGATVIIALTHMGLERPDKPSFQGDKALAAKVPGIDLIVGGHSHTAITEPQHDPANGTLIVQAGSYLTRLGRVDLEIDPKTKKVVSSAGRLYDLWVDEVGEDPRLSEIVGKYQKEVGRKLEVVVATAAQTLTREHDSESAMGDWMTDCERKWAKTDIAFQNSGGIRAELRAGPVTLRDLFSVMPFDNAVVKLKLKGAAIREILEHSLQGSVGMMQVSGLRLRYSERPDSSGRRIREARIGDSPLRDGQAYSVSAVDFIVKGGDGYSAFDSATNLQETGTLMREVLAWCARTYNPIRPAPLDRIVKD